jgi:hypothetical protein
MAVSTITSRDALPSINILGGILLNQCAGLLEKYLVRMFNNSQGGVHAGLLDKHSSNKTDATLLCLFCPGFVVQTWSTWSHHMSVRFHKVLQCFT